MYLSRRDRKDNDYARLQEQSLKMIQQLSSNEWTDFNEHDPGVTTLDIVNYALSELQHRCSFPLQAYLPDNENDLSSIGLISADAWLKPSIVTTHDYEKLILSSFPTTLKKCRVERNEQSLYTITVETKENADPEKIRKSVSELYHSNRNLAENLGEIKFDKVRTQKRRIDTKTIAIEEDTSSVINPYIIPIEYSSISLDFPDVYGINEKGLPAHVSTKRKAQALQFKAYLLIFDFMLSAVEQQIRNLPDILNITRQNHLPFLQNIDIPDIEILTDKKKFDNTSLFDRTFFDKQQSNYLDMLDTIYGEDTNALINQTNDLATNNRLRTNVLLQLPFLNTARFKAFNVFDKDVMNRSSVEKLFELLFDNATIENEECVNCKNKLFKQKKEDCCPYCHYANKSRRPVYVIEHLFFSDTPAEERNRLTIVVAEENAETYGKDKFSRILYERLPAHLHTEMVYLCDEEMHLFERMYAHWRKALSQRQTNNIEIYSKQLKSIINPKNLLL